MPNLITRIPPGATIAIYNSAQVRQVKDVIVGYARDGQGTRWGGLAILAKEIAYPLRVTVRHWSLPLAGELAGPDGERMHAASTETRGAYSQSGDKLVRQPPSKYAVSGQIGRAEIPAITMILLSPEHLPAPGGPRTLPDSYPGGVAVAIKEVTDAPDGDHDLRMLRMCWKGCGNEAGPNSDFCKVCDPAAGVHFVCSWVDRTREDPRPCNAPADESGFCAAHKPREKKPRAPRKSKPANGQKAPPKKRGRPRKKPIELDFPKPLTGELTSGE